MDDMTNSDIADEIREAFEEGYGSYTSACSSMTTFEEEWNNSRAKDLYDRLKG